MNVPPTTLGKLITPVGVVGVSEVSVTTAMHVVIWPDVIVDGVQVTVVLVSSRLIIPVPELVLWAESPPYDPMIV